MKYIGLMGYCYYPSGADDIVGVYDSEQDALAACVAKIVQEREDDGPLHKAIYTEAQDYGHYYIDVYEIDTGKITRYRYHYGSWQ